jgi:hypothetical protein
MCVLVTCALAACDPQTSKVLLKTLDEAVAAASKVCGVWWVCYGVKFERSFVRWQEDPGRRNAAAGKVCGVWWIFRVSSLKNLVCVGRRVLHTTS